MPFLAQQMGVELVEGIDLFVQVKIRFSCAPPKARPEGRRDLPPHRRRLSSIPLAFRADSMLGVPGLMNAYRAGRVTLANAVGTGIADDKSLYPYVPEMIRFYLGEEPILKNVHTWMLGNKEDLDYVIANMQNLGYQRGAGLRRLRHAGRPHLDQGRARALQASGYSMRRSASSPSPRCRSRPVRPLPTRGWRRATSTCGLTCSRARPSISFPGGLTRVALREGSLVVNSSQGGGVKDTWIVD